MKVTINIDCTPEEARAFLGLPEIAPMQQKIMERMEAEVLKAMSAMDPETLVKQWLPAGFKGMEQLQKAFWDGLSGAAPGPAKRRDKGGE